MKPLAGIFVTLSFLTAAPSPGTEIETETLECVTCHNDKIQRKATHFLKTSDDCMICHQGYVISNEHLIETKQIDTICFPCHAAQASFGLDEDHVDNLCIDCNDPHGSNNDSHFVTDAGGHCSEKCHDSGQLGRSHLIGPNVWDIAKGTNMSCVSTCHSIHRPRAEKDLQMVSTELCFQCHVDKF